jgi:hypothetical protein
MQEIGLERFDVRQVDTGFERRDRNLAKIKINPLSLFPINPRK